MPIKFPAKTNLVLIGAVIGLFIGVTIQQATGQTGATTASGGSCENAICVPAGSSAQWRAGNLILNTSNQYANGLLVPYGNVGIGTITPTAKLEVAGKIKSQGFCIDETCITQDKLRALLGLVPGSPQSTPTTTPTSDPAPVPAPTPTPTPDPAQTDNSYLPEIRYFVIDPPGPFVYPRTAKLMWDTNDVRSGCALGTKLTTSTGSNNFGGAGTPVDNEGILNTTPLIGTTVYTLTCKSGNSSGTGYNSVSKEVSVTVTSQ